MNNIIVTGATSMIGASVIAEALAQGKYVAAVIRKNSLQIGNLSAFCEHPNLKIYESEIKDYQNLTFDKSYDAFLHLAWQSTNVSLRDDAYPQIDNISFTIDALHAAHRAGCNVFLSAGSQAEYGPTSEKLCAATPCNPESGYGIAKYAAGKMAHLEGTKLGMRACHTRILSTYGVGMSEKTIIGYLIKALSEGQRPSLTKCEQMWDYMYVSDTARALLKVAESGVHGKVYPIGSGIAKPLREYVETIRDIINPELELGFGEVEYYPHQPMHLCADINELKKDTGFEAIVGFEEGIRMMLPH